MRPRLLSARAAATLAAAGCLAAALPPAAAQPSATVQPRPSSVPPPQQAPRRPVMPPSPVPQVARPAPALDAPALDLPAAAASGAAAAARLSAGTRIGLDQLTEAVLRANAGLLAARRQRYAVAAAVTSASALPNPRFDYTRGEHRARAGTGGLGGTVQAFGVSQLIENPALRRARVEAARSLERVGAQRASVARNELAAQVRQGAWDLLLRQAQAAAAAETAALLEQVQARVRARVESGEAPRYELIKAEAEIINARSLQQTGLLQAQQAALAINQLAAGTLPAQWTLDDVTLLDDGAPPPDLQALRLRMLERNPELLALRAEAGRAEALLGAARAGRWPGVEVHAGHSRDPEVTQRSLGVSVQVPLLDDRAGPVAEAAWELERVRGLADGRRAELEQQLLQAARALEMAQLRAEALSAGAVREAEAALRVADAAWRFGERGILDVLDAQRVLRSVRADLLNARFQVLSARTELDFLAGRWADPAGAAPPPPPAAALPPPPAALPLPAPAAELP